MTNSIYKEPLPVSFESRAVAEEILVRMMSDDAERFTGVKLVHSDAVVHVAENEMFADLVILGNDIGPKSVIPAIKLLVKRMMDRMAAGVKEVRGDTDHPCEYLILRSAFNPFMEASIYVFYKMTNGRWEIHMGHNGRVKLQPSVHIPVQ